MQRGPLEFRGRAAVDAAECGAEMAVAGEAEVQAQRGQILILREKIQRPRQAKAQLVAIERYALHLLEDLRQIDRGSSQLGGDLGPLLLS